jgi:hypothetical protein
MLMVASGPGVARRLVRSALDHLQGRLVGCRAERLLVSDDESSRTLGVVGAGCLTADGRLVPSVHAVADLSCSVQELRAGVRDRFRTHVNWGEQHLSMTYCNGGNADPALFREYERLHAAAAGRRTRSDESWRAMFESIVRGEAELSIAALDGELVGGILVVDGTTESYYASGAYVRERFDRPLGHWPMMDAILRSKDRGLERFRVGHVPFKGDVTEKEHSIGFFKKGFTSRLEVRLEWVIRPGEV